MKVLLAGANSYIGSRLIPALSARGYEIICLVRDKKHVPAQNFPSQVTVLTGDLLRSQSIEQFPDDIGAAYYLTNRLIHTSGFAGLEALAAQNFADALNRTDCKQIITIHNINEEVSASRQHVENILSDTKAKLTTLQSSIVIGEGSVALELFDVLTNKTPIVFASNWGKIYAQPIYIGDVLGYLMDCILNEQTYSRKLDIGGPQVLSLKQMLLTYIAIYQNERPNIVTLPLLNSMLSAYLVNSLTPLSYSEARNLIENLNASSVCHNKNIKDILPRECLNFKETLKLIHDHTGDVVLA